MPNENMNLRRRAYMMTLYQLRDMYRDIFDLKLEQNYAKLKDEEIDKKQERLPV